MSQGRVLRSSSSSSFSSSSATFSLKRPLELVQRNRVFIVKGRRNIRVRQVEPSGLSLNEGDAFVIDAKDKVFVWSGKLTNTIEKGVAAKFATDYKNDIRPMAAVVYLEGTPTTSVKQEFWKALGGECKVADEKTGGDDVVAENEARAMFKLMRVLPKKVNPSKLEVVEVMSQSSSGTDITQEMLRADPNSFVLILDCQTEIHLWHKRDAPEAHLLFAREYILQCAATRPEWTLVSEVPEHREHVLFKCKFGKWTFQQQTARQIEEKKQAEAVVPPFDVSTMFFQSERLLQQSRKRKADAGWADTHEQVTAEKFSTGEDGEVKVWIVKNSKLVLLSETDNLGHFFTAESYVVKYVWVLKEKKRCVFYTWQGRDAHGSRKGTSALLAQNMIKAETVNAQYYEDPEKHRAIQFREPEHFRRLFKGRMAYLSGSESVSAYKAVSLFHLKPTSAIDAVAVQVELTASALNSGDAFILNGNQTQYVWFGKGIQPSQRPSVLSVASSLRRTPGMPFVSVDEGNEPAEFWRLLGGHKEYPTNTFLSDPSAKPRLFDCSFASGSFSGEEVTAFCQEDLSLDHVYILDAFYEVYVWIGPVCGEQLAAFAMKVAMDYVKQHTDSRPKNLSAVYRVRSDQEPLSFTCHFLGWNGLLKASKRKRSTLQRVMKYEEPRPFGGEKGKEKAKETQGQTRLVDVPRGDPERIIKKARSGENLPEPSHLPLRLPPPVSQTTSTPTVNRGGLPPLAPSSALRGLIPTTKPPLPLSRKRSGEDAARDDIGPSKLVHLTLTRPKPQTRRPQTKASSPAKQVEISRGIPARPEPASPPREPQKLFEEPVATKQEKKPVGVLRQPEPLREDVENAFDLKSQILMYKEENVDLKNVVAMKYQGERETQRLQAELESTKAQLVAVMKEHVLLGVENVELKAQASRSAEEQAEQRQTRQAGNMLKIDQEVARLRVLNRDLSQQLDSLKKHAEESKQISEQHAQCKAQTQQLRFNFEVEKRKMADQHTRDLMKARQEYDELQVVSRKDALSKRVLEQRVASSEEEIAELKSLLETSNQELAKLGKRSRVREPEEEEMPSRTSNSHSDRGSKRLKKFHGEKTTIFRALEELEKEIGNVGTDLGQFVQSTEGMLQRMRKRGQ